MSAEMIKITPKSDVRIAYFQSIGELQRRITSTLSKHTEKHSSRYSGGHYSHGGRKWFGREDIRTVEDGVRALSNPTDAFIDMIESMRVRLTEEVMPEPKIIRRKRRWSDDRGDIDTDRFLDGDAEFYRETRRERVKGQRVIGLWINNGFNHTIHSNQVNWSAATGLALVDILERQGFAVELNVMNYAYHAYRFGQRDVFIATKLKSESDNLDVRACAGIISATGFRFGYFAAVESFGPGETSGDMGMSQSGIDPAFYVDCSNTEHYCLNPSLTKEEALASVRSVLSQIERSHDEKHAR